MYRTVLHCTVLCLALMTFLTSFSFGQLTLCTMGEECCPGGKCYDLCPPWTTDTRPVPPPTCSENPFKYLLSNRSNPTYPVVFSTTNFSQIQGYYNASKPTVIVIHGYLQSEDTTEIRNITGVYLTKVDANAIYVDYRDIASNINYYQSVSDIRVAATYVIRAVETLIGFGTSPSAIHLIGHSLGAHFAAYVAKGIRDIGRLTGLDPAGPAFTGESCEVRFCQDDAVFMEAIHTNGHPDIGFGTSDEDADVNFWVNGGWDQPECPIAVYELTPLAIVFNSTNQTSFSEFLCSHHRSVFIYNEALASNCTFWGVKPNGTDMLISQQGLGYPTKNIVNTTGCTLDNCVPIGLQTINAAGRGNFIVPTNYDSPFCVSQS